MPSAYLPGFAYGTRPAQDVLISDFRCVSWASFAFGNEINLRAAIAVDMMFLTLSTVTDQIDTLKGALRFRLLTMTLPGLSEYAFFPL